MNHLVRSSFWPFVVDGALKICYLTLHRILLDLLCILQKRKRLVFRVLITSLDSFTVCFVSTVLYRIWQTSSICFSLFCVYLSIYYLSVCRSACLLVYLPTYLPTCLPASISTDWSTSRWIGRQTDGQTNRWTNRATDQATDGPLDRPT